MKHVFIAAAIVLMVTSCKVQQQAGESDLSQASATAVDTVEVPSKELESLPAPAVGGVFQSPLPEGVALTQPHYARKDVTVTNKNGATGRRTEFEYLEGDAGQAVQTFAASMDAAGFTSNGPTSEEGVVRQVFKKPGYGTVFARAQQQDPSRNMHKSARGFVVVAWPGRGGK